MNLSETYSVVVIFRSKQGASKLLGGHRRGATPVPIPNTEVKPSTGDGTNGAVRWESSKLPGLFINPAFGSNQVRGFLFPAFGKNKRSR